MPVKKFDDPKFDFDAEVNAAVVAAILNVAVFGVINYLQRFFSNAMIPTFFKNQTKCREVYDAVVRNT